VGGGEELQTSQKAGAGSQRSAASPQKHFLTQESPEQPAETQYLIEYGEKQGSLIEKVSSTGAEGLWDQKETREFIALNEKDTAEQQEIKNFAN
jgi:hypothetical protein